MARKYFGPEWYTFREGGCVIYSLANLLVELGDEETAQKFFAGSWNHPLVLPGNGIINWTIPKLIHDVTEDTYATRVYLGKDNSATINNLYNRLVDFIAEKKFRNAKDLEDAFSWSEKNDQYLLDNYRGHALSYGIIVMKKAVMKKAVMLLF